MNSIRQPSNLAQLIASIGTLQKVAIAIATSALLVGGTTAAIAGSRDAATAAPAPSTSPPPVAVESTRAVTSSVEQTGGEATEEVPTDEVDEGESGEGQITVSQTTGNQPSTPHPGEGGALDPVNNEPVDGCVAALANGDHVAAPEAVVLEPGRLSGSVAMRNCGDGDAEIELGAQYFVELDVESFTLASGEQRTVGFTIDRDAHETGPIETKIKIFEVGCCASYVDVNAYKTFIGLDAVATDEFTAGPGAGGCNNACITTAWLTPNLTNTNLHLLVETDTPAAIELTVDTSAPDQDADGNPVLPSPFLTETSGAYRESWETSITGLSEASDYHLVLRATDEFGHTTVVTTPFRTIAPVETPGQFGGNDPEPGCSYQCITSAVLAETDHKGTELTVTTHTPASIVAVVGTSGIVDDNGALHLPNADVTASSAVELEQWSKTLNGLAPSTDYNILVTATDANGNESFQAGTFRTADEPTTPVQVVFERFFVHENGDLSGDGEVSFGWGFVLADGTTTSATRGEAKVSDAAAVVLHTGNSWTYHINSSGHLPMLRVIAGERDGNGGFSCEDPFELDGNCSYAKYTAAEYVGPSLADITAMGGCGELLAGVDPLDRCIIIEGPDHGRDHVRFDTVVRFIVG